jgi:hypothetical protein
MKKKCLYGLALALFLTGCNVPSRVTLDSTGGRTDYNVAIQQTNSSEMLLNLVRLRYYDAPFFLEVSNVTTQFTYATKAFPTLPIPGFNHSNPFSLGGEWSWQDQPTIQYAPLEGKEFAQQLLQPIELVTMQQLIHSGWDIDRLFRLVISSFDNLPNSPLESSPLPISDPEFKSFYVAIGLMRKLQLKGRLQVGVTIHKSPDDPDGKYEVLQIAFPKDLPEAHELSKILVMEEKEEKYIINLFQGYNKKGKIGVLTRSLLSCLYYLCQGVEVPSNDVEMGKVAMPEGSDEDLLNWQKWISQLFCIKCSLTPPQSAYIMVKYRNHWFYIEDNDLTTKRTFALLLQLYNLQSAEQQRTTPILSLPLG